MHPLNWNGCKVRPKTCAGEVSNKLKLYYYNCGWKLYALRRLLSLLYTVVIAKMVEGNIVGKVEKWRNGRRLLHRQSGDQLMVTGHRHTIVITQIHLTGCTNTLPDNNNIIHIIECTCRLKPISPGCTHSDIAVYNTEFKWKRCTYRTFMRND